ncbi:MAG: NAD-dependent epimerase/dehydratase family protein [Candidatus Norongarragalinales archaeon]
MKVVVTGGAGFIGSHLSEALAKQGNDVWVLDDLSVGGQNLDVLRASGAEFVKGDVRNLSLVEKVFEGADAVFHLAAMNRAMRSIKDPLEANEVNVTGTLNVLEACRKNGVKRMIFASSSSVYGGGSEKNREEQALHPLHPYGVGKLAGEEYCRVYNSLYGVETVSLRYVSVYGPRQRSDIPYAAVIPKFVGAVLSGKPLQVFGSGKQKRQFTFVKDTVEGTIAAWKSKKAAGEIFNIAYAKESSVLEIARALEKITGKTAVVVHSEPIPGDPLRNAIDVSKAKKILGFSASRSLEEGLKETVNSFRK